MKIFATRRQLLWLLALGSGGTALAASSGAAQPAAEVDGFAPATALLDALRGRRLSATELLELHLRRIERFNPALNAIVVPDLDNARRAAAAADATRAAGQERPLLGLPVTIKDNLDVAGLATTAGIPARAGAVAAADAAVVARVRAAGTVLLGKTNLPPAASDWQTNNPLFGRTNNPWDLARTPGGSTGGGAAALAAGLTPLELATDIAGSIRVPAAYCGVYGHKPSETLVPRSGQAPDPPLPNPAKILNVQGPLARDPADLELALDVIAGPDLGEDVAWQVRLPSARHERLTGFRVAVLPSIPWLPVDDEISAALDGLAASLGRAGATVGMAQPAGFGDLIDYSRRYSSLLFVNVGSPAATTSAVDYLAMLDQRERHRAAFRAFFREWDVLLAPASPVTAFPHDDAPIGERTLVVNGQSVPYFNLSVYPALATLPGQPATAFPAGLSRSGLPIGLQAIGPYLEDRTPIRFAALVGREFGGFRPPPGYT